MVLKHAILSIAFFIVYVIVSQKTRKNYTLGNLASPRQYPTKKSKTYLNYRILDMQSNTDRMS